MSGTVPAADLDTVARTRAGMLREAAEQAREHLARVVDLDAGGVPARLYVPAGATETIVFVHGGGFVYGEPDTHDAHTRRMANRTGRAVLFVHYRRAPESPYPAAVEDTLAAADWWHERAGEHGLDPARQVILGDSAGANLALVAALHRPGRYRAQVLVYPFLDPAMTSYDDALADPELDLEECAWFWRMYAPDRDRWAEPDLDPLRAGSLAGLPPTLVQLAELDVLVPTGRLLADRIVADGGSVEQIVYPGVPHGFWRRFDNDRAEPAQADLRTWLDAGRG